MAKKDDNTILYLGLGALALLWLRSRSAVPTLPAVNNSPAPYPPAYNDPHFLGPPARVADVQVGQATILLMPGQSLPSAPSGLQWYAVPVGNAPADGGTLYILQPIGTKLQFDPREIV